MTSRRDPDSPDATVLRALLVDDDLNYRAFVASLLRRAGITPETASDGQEALELVQSGRTYDLLLVDFEMPRLNGLELIRRLRDESATVSTYAVMLTGHDDVETRVAALTAGFDDVLTKRATDLELTAKFGASRRLVLRQQTSDATMRELRGQATTDELTGLLNRRFFFSEAKRVVAEAADACLVIFDLDRFKDINDTHGHLVGDQVLRDVAAVLRLHTRYEDFVVRFGGDEFVMITRDLSPRQLEEIVERIASRVGTLRWTVGTDSVEVGLTAGVATTSLLPERSLRALLDAADRDLYKNKVVKRSPASKGSSYDYGRSAAGEVVGFPPPPGRISRRRMDEKD